MIDVVIVNYKRPDNIKPIVAAFRQQTVEAKITLVDAGNVEADVDSYVKVSENNGAWNRYSTCMTLRGEFVYYHDDDMLPGPKVLENFLKYTYLPFGVLGQIGRKWGTGSYSAFDIRAGSDPLPIDCVVRGYFLRPENLSYLMKCRSYHTIGSCDDLWLCKSMSILGGLTTYVVPIPTDAEQMNQKELPAPFAVCERPGRGEIRNAALAAIKRLEETA